MSANLVSSRNIESWFEAQYATHFQDLRRRYGAPRLTLELNEAGIACSVNHVAKLMPEAGLKARNGKNFRYSPDGSSINNVSANILNRDFTVLRPNEKWVSDITYIPIQGGHVYLAVIMDLFSRKIIGWSLDKTMTTQLIMDALNMATASRQCEPDLLLHSDQGVQYRSSEYVLAMHDANITPSMSRRGSCWDNAAMESFFSRLKVEEVFGRSYRNLKQVYSRVFEYIEMFYNRVRKHSAIDYASPAEYEQYYYEECA
ncbi:IS3 family transposase [Agaribacterium sp. ZY112]|uniref:IS3 family transposase n=1 Tax=Agaribacterium sp. ZY112 TaxID=3233574 RepID=UPI0035232C38